MSERTRIRAGIEALKRDLTGAGGPQISTMRNYRFALFQYLPEEEFELRHQMAGLCKDLRKDGWGVLSIDLQKLLVDRVRANGEDVLRVFIERERRLFEREPARALEYLRDKIGEHVEGPNGIAADVIREIRDFVAQYPGETDRTLVLIGRAGALYPFFKTSALLRHIDGQTQGVPVVFLYPGTRKEQSALSFMGVVPADRDYRPRIYP